MAREAVNLVERQDIQANYEVLVPGKTTILEMINVEPGQKEVLRGAILVEGANKMYKKAASADIATGKKLVIANDYVDTGAEATGVSAVINAIVSGLVIRDNVKVEGGELTAANELTLREQGINFTSMVHNDGKHDTVNNKL